MTASKRFFNLFFILAITSFHTYGNNFRDSSDNIVVKNLNEDWLIYNHQYDSYFPLLDKHSLKVTSICQFVDLNKYKKYNLNFIAAPDLSLFLGNQLCYKNSTGKEKNVKLNIDDLLKNINNQEDVPMLTFYHPNGKLPFSSFYIGHFANNTNGKSEGKASISLSREFNQKENLYIFTFIFILFIFALIRNRYPKKFYEFSNFSNIIPSTDDGLLLDISSAPVFLFILINSLCVALILFLIREGSELNSLRIVNIFDQRPVLGLVIISSFFFFAYLIKYLYMKIAGWVFNLSEFVKIQFYELLKVSLKINLFMAAFTFILYSSGYFNLNVSFQNFFYSIVISLFIVLFRVGYLTFKLSGFRNIYLFSYLCTTEILPLVIIIKLILF